MHRAFAIVILVCSLALISIDVSSGNAGGAAWSAVGIPIALWFWYFDRGQRKRLNEYEKAEAERAALRTLRGAAAPRRYDFEELVARVNRNLSSSGFDISRNIELPNGESASLVASRTEFSLPGLANVSVIEHLFLQHRPGAAAADFDFLFEGGFQYAGGKLRRFPVWPPRSGHLILPCLAVDTVTPELISFASGRPPKRWMRFEFPVLFDLSTGSAYCCATTPALGAMFFPSARALVNLAFEIEPSTTSA